jgi:thiamine pyrophosphate-dependent acetolactate synthase large subunit-like protein
MNGGARIARVLYDRGVREIFTLCGGHISPILVEAKRIGIRVTDVRDEATAVFAADAYARLTGIPGVAAVTAGPGLTNTITPLKNAQLAQSPVLVLGGATATALKNRGALQDIDQMPLMTPHVKFARAVKRLRDLAPAVVEALEAAETGVPGPVFVECPVDLLYDEEIIRGWYADSMPRGDGARGQGGPRLPELAHERLFAGGDRMPKPASRVAGRAAATGRHPRHRETRRRAKRPVMVCGSQALARAGDADLVRDAIIKLGIPVYLSGMSRGLLGANHPLLFRHRRRDAIKGADLVILAGVPCDFRLDYGKQIRRSARLVSFNLSRRELRLNRKPDDGLLADPGLCLRDLADAHERRPPDRSEWFAELTARDEAREADISERAAVSGRASTRCACVARSTRSCRTTACWSPTAATSSAPPPTSCGRADRCAGWTRAPSARSASAGASRSARRARGPRPRSGSSTATARSATA